MSALIAQPAQAQLLCPHCTDDKLTLTSLEHYWAWIECQECFLRFRIIYDPCYKDNRLRRISQRRGGAI